MTHDLFWSDALTVRRYPRGRPDPFRSVRDLGRVPVRRSCESEVPEDGSSRWLPARRVHGSGGGGSHISNLYALPAYTRSLISPAAEIIPCIFRIIDISAVSAWPLQRMARRVTGGSVRR